MRSKSTHLELEKLHQLQIKALMAFIGSSLALAAKDKDPSVLIDIKTQASELIEILHGCNSENSWIH